MAQINELLDDAAVALDVRAHDWRQAIGLAGRLLEDTGATTADYTQAMIDNVEDNGPYIVVAPGFAFAHARPSVAVKTTAVSWVRLAEPVAFGHASNDPVTLVVALAAQDDKAHTRAMRDLSKLLGDADRRRRLDTVATVAQLREVLEAVGTASARPAQAATTADDEPTVASKGKILTVCGNGLGTSLFLKNTLEDVLTEWGWGGFVDVEATDTISAKGRAKEADFILTSGEIAATLGDVGVPVHVVENFTSRAEIDSALRDLYAV